MSTEKKDQMPAAAGYAGLPKRHTYSRWDYQEDRHKLMRWINSKRTCQALDWQWNGQRLTIKVEPSRHRLRWYQIDAAELDMCRLSWRWLVARAIKQCRLDLSDHAQQTGGA
jgi:hypothetical protein